MTIPAIDFVRELHRGADPAHLVELRAVPAERVRLLDRRFVPVGDPALPAVIDALIARNAREPSMIAFSVNPRARCGGADVDVGAVVAATVDLDGKALPIIEQRRRLDAIAHHAPIAAWVASGSTDHGHAYWRIVPPEADRERARTTVRRLRRYLAADPSEPPSKVMRLPGSWHWKTGRPVLVGARVWPATATLDALDAALDAIGAPQAGPPVARPPRRLSAPRAVEISDATPIDRDHLRAVLSAAPQWARNLIRDGWQPGGRYPSRSEADLAALGSVVRAGATDAEAAYLMARWPIGEKTREEPYRLGRLLDLLRKRPAPIVAAPVTARIEIASWAPPGQRALLRLRLPSGESLVQGVSVGSAAWTHLWRAVEGAGSVKPAENTTLESLVGRSVSLVLRSGAWGDRKVTAWIPFQT